ncbi:proline--tRNA ligase [Paenibacillus sp. HB172176]|uniref:proline--tRNA ligase n=1 Tax=Paenibacillus sp. HB172176 TaxID=2493690 RepID=UPI00143CA8B5|nr:proline--tRNA ligase [Paenibacillus sp. HB172176]
MLQSRLFGTTLRETPSEAEAISHQLMLRAGLIRQLAAGIYTYLPLGRRVLRKVESIVREEMEAAGAQEVLMPALQPGDLWKESGRYEVYGPELMRLQDRHEREFVLGPTHEEVVTKLVREEINTYRRLPVILYQIQTKFRDERRPRFGLLRGREFLMKDAYSFDSDWDSLDRSYRRMFEAYKRIFQRCGIAFRAVEADAGSIGGEGGTHEFMALADIGEDTVVVCTHCDYAANLEKAEAIADVKEKAQPSQIQAEKFHTPELKTIEQLAEALDIPPSQLMKTLIYLADGELVAVVVRGDHEVNELKVMNALSAAEIELAGADAVHAALGHSIGSIGPIGLPFKLLVDYGAASMPDGIAGANEDDFHLRHVQPGRDFPLEHVGDYRNVLEGEGCPRCEEGKLKFHRGIELGHVFKLGTKYSEKLSANYLDACGKSQPFIMGCYGIGISRILSAVIEQHHDEGSILWPMSIAPYQVHIVPVSMKDEEQLMLARGLYDSLTKQGVEVLLDDRDERPGIKFKDSDLMGIPLRLIVGKHAGQGQVEYVVRSRHEKLVVSQSQAEARILSDLREIEE